MFLKHTYAQSNDDIMLKIKALLCSNSGLLKKKATTRVRKIALLDKFAYPELRLVMLSNPNNITACLISVMVHAIP